MADHKTRILSTRPLEAALLEQAAGRGIMIDTLPFIVTEPIVDETLQSRIRELSRRPLIAVFTSMNAVEAVAGHLGRQPAAGAASASKIADSPVASAPFTLPWRIYSIGYATQQLVRQHFGSACIAGTAASAAALADTIIRQQAIAEVTFFCGDQRRDELPEKLQEQAIRVNEWVVYKTVRTPHKVKQVYDGIVFFSPSAVHSFFAENSIPAGTVLFAIGQTTADTIRTYTPDNYTILSGSPEKEALIRQVIDYYNRAEPGCPEYINKP
ncbi:MAG TPA: uroporphyrinogen-III synthase [Puia sp.]